MQKGAGKTTYVPLFQGMYEVVGYEGAGGSEDAYNSIVLSLRTPMHAFRDFKKITDIIPEATNRFELDYFSKLNHELVHIYFSHLQRSVFADEGIARLLETMDFPADVVHSKVPYKNLRPDRIRQIASYNREIFSNPNFTTRNIYLQSASLFRYLYDTHGQASLDGFIETLKDTSKSFDTALEDAYNLQFETIIEEWKQFLSNRSSGPTS